LTSFHTNQPGEYTVKDTITTIYCLCDDFLKAMSYQDDPQATLSSAEVMTVPLVAAVYFRGHLENSYDFLHEHAYIPTHLSKGQFNRRLHALPVELWYTLLGLLSEVFKARNSSGQYVVDTLPIPVCDNIRIRRCRLFQGEAPRGYIASKRRFFYGLKVHLVSTGAGEPLDFVLTPGSTADLTGLKLLNLDLPAGSTLLGDRAYNDYYNDYEEEDWLQAAGEVTLQPQRKKNSKRPLPTWLEFLGKPVRQRIETSFSQITSLFPKHIHAVTPQGFVLKVICFLLAFSIQCL
jgi:hypothetical protein